MQGFEDISKDAISVLERKLEEAYKAGFERGREQAASEFRAKLEQVFTAPSAASQAPADFVMGSFGTSVVTEQDERAAPGTIKPAIIAALRSHPEGLFRREIVDLTGIKPNSVRGTLWQLQKESQITKNDNDKWVLKGSLFD